MNLVCFSHLRWGFVFQRPNHLMSRFAREGRTYFIEEPVPDADSAPRFELQRAVHDLVVCTPHVPASLTNSQLAATQRELLDALLLDQRIEPELLWFYTPMALEFARHLSAPVVVYDCMDELSAFDAAPPELPSLEDELFRRADLVFTGGHALYRAKRQRHPRVHPFPSSVDAEHFRSAREPQLPPTDQRVPRPRIGYFGVIDERIDLQLIAQIAEERPSWHLTMIGPVVKIDPATLPRRPNIHWLGPKDYSVLPGYVGGWDVAIMPFALNRATRFISPTKTLEYLAAGVPVVSTAIEDVVEPYGRSGVVAIADRNSFAAAIDAAMNARSPDTTRRADAVLAQTSWENTWGRMRALIREVRAEKEPPHV